MIRIILTVIIIAMALVFIIWKPWKELKDFTTDLKRMHASLSKGKNAGELCRRLIKFLLIPILIVLLIAMYRVFASHHEHDYTDTIVREATCTEEGVIRHQCRYCDHVEEEPLPVIPHQYEESSRIEPTCVESGTLTETCKGCGDTRTKPIPATGKHDYAEIIVREATCTEEGVIRYHCRFCDDAYEDTLPLIPHQGDEISRTEPTCVESGTIVKTCIRCGNTYMEPIPATGKHDYAEIIVKEAACEDEGVMRYQCRFCDDAYEKTLPAVGHQHKETSRTEPTCAKPGTITFTCYRCGDTYTKTIPKTEHRYSEVKREIPDCIKKKQIIYYRCDICGHEKTETAAPIGKHQYIKSYSVKRSFLKVGHDIFICSVCNSQYFAIKLHKFSWVLLILYAAVITSAFFFAYIWGKRRSVRRFSRGSFAEMITDPFFWICFVATVALTVLSYFLTAKQFQELCRGSGYSIKLDGFNWLSGIGLLLILIILIAAFCINIYLGDEAESCGWVPAVAVVFTTITIILYFIFGRQITVCIQTDAKAHIHESQQPVEITGAEASSVLNVRGEIYYVEYSYDNNIKTSWQEAAAGDGSGETITYKLDQARYIVGMDIINGRVDTKQNYYDNNRIKSLVVYYYLGDTIKAQKTVDLDDVYSMEPVHFTLIDGSLSDDYYCDSIRIEFKAVYKGQKFNDLCLTDIKFYEGTFE